MTFNITIDTKELKNLSFNMIKLERDFPKLTEKVRRNLAEKTKNYAKQNIKPKWESTGNLANSIVYRKEGANRTEVIVEAPYAIFVEAGTKPHKMSFIPGSKGDKLSTGWRTEKGKPYVPGSVRMHPGTDAMWFMSKAYEKILVEANDIIGEEVTKFFVKRGM